MNNGKVVKLNCPLPRKTDENVLLAHGGGGKLMHNLIEQIIVPSFDNKFLETKHDGAVLNIKKERLAFTTDSYVIKPLFFPGGDIGSLAVNGTVNDLAMCGAKPLYLSVGFILEEGLSLDVLKKIVESMKTAADKAGVSLVTGDTKVVDNGSGDGIFINTAGIGVVEKNVSISPQSIKEEDVIILSGDIGRHGIAIMAEREGLSFESKIKSDCAPLSQITDEILKEVDSVHCFRDLTRGGLASALVEIAEAANVQIEINETDILVSNEVQGACEILGLEPIYIANEGRFITFAAEQEAERIIKIMKKYANSKDAKIIGKVKKGSDRLVSMKGRFGTSRIIDMLSGEQLPRIC